MELNSVQIKIPKSQSSPGLIDLGSVEFSLDL